MLKKLNLSWVIALIVSVSAFAQTGTLTGQITDADTGEPIIGAAVYIESLQRGTTSNIDGEYTLDLPVGTYTLTARFLGYRTYTTEVEVGTGTVTLDIQLEVDLVGLDEVIVTGYGSIDRQAFTGTISSVTSDKLAQVPVSSVDQALQGNATGVIVTSPSGTPGTNQSIRIRGISSINASTAPLYVIDGVPVVSGSLGGGGTSSLGVLSNLNNSDVESITILKDAAATAPYGARGSNGVIVITTKSGRAGQTTYSFSAQRGTNSQAVDGQDALTADQWGELVNESLVNNPAFGPAYANYYEDVLNPEGHYTNWGKETRDQDAIQQEYFLSARGGNETTNFYTSVGVFEQEGFIKGTSLERVSGKVDVSHRFDDRIRLQNSLTGSWANQDGGLEGAGYFGSPVLAKFFIPPYARAYNEDGTPNTSLPGGLHNPVYLREYAVDYQKNTRILNNTQLDINLLENLNFTSRFAIDYLIGEGKEYDDPFHGDAVQVGGRAQDNVNRIFNYVWQNVINYIWMPSVDHQFTFKGITESQRNYNKSVIAYGEGFAAPGLINVATTGGTRDASSSTTDWAVQSFTGLVNYGYQDKLYFDGSIRYEGSSRFAADNRWGTFWSAGLGYVISEEDFMQDISWLNFLKIRTSYGLTGNAGVSLNSYQATVGFGSYNNEANILTNQLGNEDLSWETATSFDVGLEFEIFDRLSGSVTYFNKESSDLLFSVPLSRTTGHTSQTQNIGELYNRGIEAELNIDVIRTRDLKWNIGGNISTIKNEVTDLPKDGNGEYITIQSSLQYTAVIGYPVRTWFMKEWAGVDPENGDPLWYMDVLDANGNPTGERTTTNDYTLADEYDMGASQIPTLFGGINSRLDVKGFYASATLYYSFGNKVYDNWAGYMMSDGFYTLNFNQYASQYDRWQQPGDIAKNPKLIYGGNKRSNSASSRRLYDGDYLRLRNLNIGYNIPTDLLQSVGLKGATVYFQGQNLWTYAFDEDLNFDPEQGSSILNLNVPPLKSITFGINVNF